MNSSELGFQRFNKNIDPIIWKDSLEYEQQSSILKQYDSVFITGSSGMLGGYLAEFLSLLSFNSSIPLTILVQSRQETKNLQRISQIPNLKVKIINELEMYLEIDKYESPLIIHTASPASRSASTFNLQGLIHTNLEMTMNIVNKLKNKKGCFVYFSSGEIYGPEPQYPTSEDMSSGFNHLNPNFAYAEAKKAGEFIVSNSLFELDCYYLIPRIYHTFGPGISIHDPRIFGVVMKSLLRKDTIVLKTNGSTTRNFLYNSDLVGALMVTLKEKSNFIFNLAGATEISILDFCRIAIKSIDPNVGLEIGSSVGDVSPIARGSADISKLENLGWKNRIELEDALMRTYQSVLWRNQNGF
jgi:UDP-glucuronate decarboxylase